MKKYAKEFRVSDAPQRSPQWYIERAGIPSASGLGFLFDTLKDGYSPSAKAREYLKRLAYERKFGVTHDQYDTKAMQDGRYYEDFAKVVYMKDTGNLVSEATSYLSSWFVATPDGHVQEITIVDGLEILGKKGLIECKVVKDNSFMDFAENSLPIEHELQTQGQMLATGADWVDYVVVNIKTRAYYIRRVHRNNKMIKRIYERLHEPINLPEIDFGDVRKFDEGLLESYISGQPQGAPPPEASNIIVPF